MPAVTSFNDIAQEFEQRVGRIVTCTVTTVDTKGRPRARILHPLWEGSTAWIVTDRQSFKAKHIAKNPYVSLSYWDPQQEQVYAECKASWEEDPAEKDRVWNLFKNTPPPRGYDPAQFMPEGPAAPSYGALKDPVADRALLVGGLDSGQGPAGLASLSLLRG